MNTLWPTQDELQATIQAFKALGGRFELRYRWHTQGSRRRHVGFDSPASVVSTYPDFHVEKRVTPDGGVDIVVVDKRNEHFSMRREEPILFFVMGRATNDNDLKRMPTVPFSCGLDLRGTLVTDMGLKAIAKLQNLLALGLNWTSVTGAGLNELAALQHLAAIDLSETDVTDEGLKGLASIQNLSALDLSQTKVTDAGLKELAALINLSWLDLSGSFKHWGLVTDAGLKELGDLKNLLEVRLGLGHVTEAGVLQLQLALPTCWVSMAYGGSDFEVTIRDYEPTRK